VTPLLHSTSSRAKEALSDRTTPVVVIPVYNGYDDTVRCIESLVRHTPSDADILIVDDVGSDRRIFDLLTVYSSPSSPRISILQQSVNGGFIGACNAAFSAAGQRDVILVNSDVVVGPEWYERMSSAAQSSNVIATASALTNHGTILSIPVRNEPSPMIPGNSTVDEVAVKVAKTSLQLRPTIQTAVGHCTYVKRSALNRVGAFDTAFGKGYGEEVDFSQRASRAGFRHICVDDVFVFHRGGGSFGAERTRLQEKNEKVINARYPYYPTATSIASEDTTSALALALLRASIAVNGLKIAVDGSCLGPDYMGTQHVVVETVRALSRSEAVQSIILYVPRSISAETRSKVEGTDNVRVEFFDQPAPFRADIAYRPYQLTNTVELNRMRSWGRWTVVNQLDVIAFHNPAYFPNVNEWFHYREMTRLILHAVDGVAFISEHARREVNSELLVGPGVAQRTVYCGSDFVTPKDSVQPNAKIGRRPFVFALGASYLHKSRRFSIEVLKGLIDRGWDGDLVLAGPTPPNGNSLGEEAELFLLNPGLADRVITLGSITDPEKRWLFENAAAFLYPSVVEGFGFMPFEAAHYGVAAVSSRGGSLAEVLPDEFPTITEFDISSAVDLAWNVINDRAAAHDMVETIRSGGGRFTWDATIHHLLELFDDVTRRRPSIELAVIGERSNALELHSSQSGERSGTVVPLRRDSLGKRHPLLKRIFSPEGSRRQRLARRAINKLRKVRARVRS